MKCFIVLVVFPFYLFSKLSEIMYLWAKQTDFLASLVIENS